MFFISALVGAAARDTKALTGQRTPRSCEEGKGARFLEPPLYAHEFWAAHEYVARRDLN